MQKSVNSINIDYQQNQSIYLPINKYGKLWSSEETVNQDQHTPYLYRVPGFLMPFHLGNSVYSILPVALLCGCWFMKPVSVSSNHYITITTVICIMLTHETVVTIQV